MTKILSIDPGIKHLSYCYMHVTSENKINILDWNNICVTESNCKTISFELLVEQLIESLTLKFDDSFEADIVLIENQPLTNNKMKSVSVAIYTYFNILKIQYGNIQKVHFIKATEKLKCKKNIEIQQDSGKKTYKDRKKYSIELCKLYLKNISLEQLEWFNKQKKCDDLGDSALAAIFYIEKHLGIQI